MTASSYHLQIVRFTQSGSANGSERKVIPENIDEGQFLHLYVSGNFPQASQLRLSRTKLASGSTYTYPKPGVAVGRLYKFTITHYTLDPRTRFRFRAFERHPKTPNANPVCVASHNAKTR